MSTIPNNVNPDFHTIFYEDDLFYSSNTQELTLIQKQDKAISPWHQKQSQFQNKTQHRKQRPQLLDFLCTCRDKQTSFRSKVIKKKNKSFSSGHKNQKFYQLNNTVIAFPKSIQYTKEQNLQEEKIFQKYCSKRQKLKLVPKEIKLSNLQNSAQKMQKIAKHLSYIKKNRSPDFKQLNQKKIYEVGSLSPILKDKNQTYKIKKSISMNQVSQKFYKTINFQKIINKTRNQLIERAKISHLNINPSIQTLQIQCMGSTISNWISFRSAYLNKMRK